MKLWKIYGTEKNNPYEIHADTKEEAVVNFLDNELHLRLSVHQFNDAVKSLQKGNGCMLITMLMIDEVLE